MTEEYNIEHIDEEILKIISPMDPSIGALQRVFKNLTREILKYNPNDKFEGEPMDSFINCGYNFCQITNGHYELDFYGKEKDFSELSDEWNAFLLEKFRPLGIFYDNPNMKLIAEGGGITLHLYPDTYPNVIFYFNGEGSNSTLQIFADILIFKLAYSESYSIIDNYFKSKYRIEDNKRINKFLKNLK